MFLFALLSRICHGLVQRSNGTFKSRNLLHQCADEIRKLRKLCICLREFCLCSSLLVGSFVEFTLAILFLCFVLLLLFSQEDNHIIDHLLYFIKASCRLHLELGAQGVKEKIEMHVLTLSCN